MIDFPLTFAYVLSPVNHDWSSRLVRFLPMVLCDRCEYKDGKLANFLEMMNERNKDWFLIIPALKSIHARINKCKSIKMLFG